MAVLKITQIVKRNGSVANFDEARIKRALLSAYEASSEATDTEQFDTIYEAILREIENSFQTTVPHVEQIQDIVEQHLVRADLYEIAKHYILYREKHREIRERRVHERLEQTVRGALSIRKRDGRREPFSTDKIRATLHRVSNGGIHQPMIEAILTELPKNIFDGITAGELEKALVLSITSLIELDTAYDTYAARVVLQGLYREAMPSAPTTDNFQSLYRRSFVENIATGVKEKLYAAELVKFDTARLAKALKPERDRLFNSIGIQTLYERYIVALNNRRIECPQSFWMRVAMGLALRETAREDRAIEFYEIFSTLRFLPSTPTLFHAGLVHPQLSSCYVSTVGDDLGNIFKIFADNAQLSKWSGGIGNDWSAVRATGSRIKSTNVDSQGIIPFLKIANDTTVAINRSGKRRGATCAYLETWHLDIEDFLDLRRNTGDDRRRTHDMNTANWIPDLFMKRVLAEEKWTLFSPDEVPDLHEIYGAQFEERYLFYEQEARAGRIHHYRSVDALQLWRKMLTRLFETGHPWITFKDPCNIRSPQDHQGVIHNSNLCTEITLNNSKDETAVCNLGSINLARHMHTSEGVVELDSELLAHTVESAIRALDNVIDINFYPTVEARNANLKHRPIALGLMGFQDALFMVRAPFESPEALTFADSTVELISYHAILTSSRLARERGRYESYSGSKWDRGLFPIDTIALLEKERGMPIEISRTARLDWHTVRAHVRQYGMRNSNTMAIAPTATISNISGCLPSIEPIYKNLYVKANMSGEFTVINSYLEKDLKNLGLWSREIVDEIKYYDGDIELIKVIPPEIRRLYRGCFNIDPKRLLELSAVRSKWIDQSQSHTVFVQGSSGKHLHEIYTLAWKLGLKTTYYLRALGASQIEKATLDAKKYGYTQQRVYDNVPKVCSIADPDCEACQ